MAAGGRVWYNERDMRERIPRWLLCNICKKWKATRFFSPNNQYINPSYTKCRVCVKKGFAKWYKSRGKKQLSDRRRVTESPEQADNRVYQDFMRNNEERMKYGLDPKLKIPGLSGRRVFRTVDEARKAVDLWCKPPGA